MRKGSKEKKEQNSQKLEDLIRRRNRTKLLSNKSNIAKYIK